MSVLRPIHSFQTHESLNCNHCISILLWTIQRIVKEKYGSDAEEGAEEEEDSEELESEDEDGEELTPGVDAAILRTLAKIKRRDPDIYDKERAIFEGGPF